MGPLFRPLRNNRTGTLGKTITADMAYKLCEHCMARIYDHRKTVSEDSPVFKVSY